MRPAVVFHYLGMLLAVVGGFMLATAVVSAIYDDGALIPILLSALITIGSGVLLWLVTRGGAGAMRRKESFLVVALAWALGSAFGALPFILAGTFNNYLDAFFESMGGFTTTGASVLTDIEAQPHGILFWRGLTQWLGGIGIVAFFLSALPLGRMGAAGASAMYEDEVPGPQSERVTPRLRETIRILWLIYLAFTVACLVLLLASGIGVFDAITVTFSTIASGGYAPRNASIGYYDSVFVDWVVIAFMTIAGVNFGLYYMVWRQKPLRALADTEFRIYMGIMAGLSGLIALDLFLNAGYKSPGKPSGTLRSTWSPSRPAPASPRRTSTPGPGSPRASS